VRTSGSNHSSKQRWVLALTSVAALMVGLDILVVTTALTTIRLHLGSSPRAHSPAMNLDQK
jgi:hypothetical protein